MDSEPAAEQHAAPAPANARIEALEFEVKSLREELEELKRLIL